VKEVNNGRKCEVLGAVEELQARKEALAQLQQEQWTQMHCRMDSEDQQYIIGGQVCIPEPSTFTPA
jgi:hypothetical protein